MLEFLNRAKQYLWLFVEIGFLALLAIILIHLILGQDSGVFIASVADNVVEFTGSVAPQSLVGIAIVLALVFLVANRMK